MQNCTHWWILMMRGTLQFTLSHSTLVAMVTRCAFISTSWGIALGRALISHCSLWWCVESLTTSSIGHSHAFKLTINHLSLFFVVIYTESYRNQPSNLYNWGAFSGSDMNIASGCPLFLSRTEWWVHLMYFIFISMPLHTVPIAGQLSVVARLLNYTDFILFILYYILFYCFWKIGVNCVGSYM